MQWSQKPSGHGGIRRALALITVSAAMAGALLLTSCSQGEIGEFFVKPANDTMVPGEYQQYKLYVGTESGIDERVFCDQWSASGGTINESGTFRAPKEPGRYTITASEDGIHSTNVTVVPKTTQSGESSPDGGTAKAQGEKERIFENASDAGGHPGAKIPEFTINRPRVIVEIMTYHWDYNDHKLGTIALKNVETGKTYGPWETVGGTGQGGVENAYWLAHPNVEIPSGTYELVDSSPSTWFTNSEMKGYGGAYVDALK